MDKLKGKVCIVTGASGGIGKSVVTKLATQGANLILAARRGTDKYPLSDVQARQGIKKPETHFPENSDFGPYQSMSLMLNVDSRGDQAVLQGGGSYGQTFD